MECLLSNSWVSEFGGVVNVFTSLFTLMWIANERAWIRVQLFQLQCFSHILMIAWQVFFLFMQKVNLSSCPQITMPVLLSSVLPSLCDMEPILRKNIALLSFNAGRFDGNHQPLSQRSFPTLSFESVQEVDISKCQRLHLENAIECFSMSFPSLKTLRAAYLLNFDISTLHHLVKKCPKVYEVDLSTDISPIEQLPIVTPSPANVTRVWNNSVYTSNCPQSNITKLTLEGRSDLQGEVYLFIFSACFVTIFYSYKKIFVLSRDGNKRGQGLTHPCPYFWVPSTPIPLFRSGGIGDSMLKMGWNVSFFYCHKFSNISYEYTFFILIDMQIVHNINIY